MDIEYFAKEKNLYKLNCDVKILLENGELSSQDVIELMGILTYNYKSWRSQWWKDNQIGKIGLQCTQCGSQEKPLVLQHFFHPRKFMDIYSNYRNEAFAFWKEQKSLPELSTIEILSERDGCPKCCSTSIYYRKSVSQWICHGKQNRRECGFVFDSPIKVMAKDVHATHDLKVKENQNRYEKFIEEYDLENIRKSAVSEWLQDNIRYLSFSDTTTFCKKCAFLWDMKGMAFCSNCDKWHYIFSPCPSCGKLTFLNTYQL